MKRSCLLFFVVAMISAGRLAAQSPSLQVLQAFGGLPDGSSPAGPLIQGSDGNFYGTTCDYGSNHGPSTIYEVTPAGVFTILYTFAVAADEVNPAADLTQGADGNLYGTTYDTFFKITPAGVFTAISTFTGGADGEVPSGLTQGNDGNFYGTTKMGGDLLGTVFMITPSGVYTILHTFTGDDGQYPESGVIQGNDGNFYGTTTGGFGGSVGNGTIFKITPAGVFSTIYTFTGGADGAYPFAGLVQGSDGNFYGMTTSSGNQRGDGSVFKITPDGVLTTLYEFNGEGRASKAALTQGSDGNFYGTTSSGGIDGSGTIFEITPAGVFTTLYAFTGGADGSFPTASVIQGKDGNLYGTTPMGGLDNLGVVFRLNFPLPAVFSKTVSAQAGLPFSFLILATNSPTSFGASNLPPGLSLDAATGIISGTTAQTGTFTIGISATNSYGTGSGTLTLTINPAPAVTLAATVPNAVVGSGDAGEFTLSLSAPASADLVIRYAIKGTAINGVDYDLIETQKKIKAGKTSKIISVVPEGNLGGASKKGVTLVLKPGPGYVIGTTGKVKVKILPAP